MDNYALAPDGVYFSVQGEGHLRGFSMTFVRLAGCSVGCPRCDTDYTKDATHDSDTIAEMAASVMPAGFRDRWVWVTGGEPYDRPMRPLIKAFRRRGLSVAVATSGKHRVIEPVDWCSVSYHGGYPLLQRYGHEIKLIDGLNGLDLDAFIREYPDEETDFFYRYVQPITIEGAEDPASLERCMEFIQRHPNWSLSRQDHLAWRVR